jgi:3-hydroxyisobutyrate dehydrogenase-like beta-hydroxyacid dehydrogenase
VSEEPLKVAVIGLGRMGGAMARRFSEAGFDLVVWNRDRAKSDQLAAETGSLVADTPADAATRAEISVTSLADDAALKDVYLGASGVAAGIKEGTLALDTSTVDPSTIDEVGRALDDRGATFIDCPVSGSVSSVEAGTLTIMAGGEPDSIARARPLLTSISKRLIRVGERGAGSACKLAVNSLLHGLNIALSEALVLAERAGVDRATAYEVFASGAAGAPFLDYKREAYENPEEATVAFSLDLVYKDLELITSLGDRVGAPMKQAMCGLEIVREAVASGMAGDDLSAVASYLRSQAS